MTLARRRVFGMDIIDRYVALWNEPDAHLRREGIRGLFAAEAVHLLQAPDEMRAVAADYQFIEA